MPTPPFLNAKRNTHQAEGPLCRMALFAVVAKLAAKTDVGDGTRKRPMPEGTVPPPGHQKGLDLVRGMPPRNLTGC
jgi:hypothetical protein